MRTVGLGIFGLRNLPLKILGLGFRVLGVSGFRGLGFESFRV